MNKIMMTAFSDELSKIAAGFKFLSPLAQGHAASLKSMGGIKKAKGLEQVARKKVTQTGTLALPKLAA